MKIVVDRDELMAIAERFRADSGNLLETGRSLSFVSVAGLPGGLAERVSAAITSTSRDLEDVSSHLVDDAADLRRRAFWAALAAGEIGWWSLMGMLLGFGAAAFGLNRGYLLGLTAEERYRLLQGLTPDEQTRLAEMYPELIGPLDGAPFHMRYIANRALIQREIARLEAQLLGVPEGKERDRLQEKLDRYRRWADPKNDRKFLLFDPRGDGRAAEVFGDLANADYVTVLVPGVGNDLENFDSLGGHAKAFLLEMGDVTSRPTAAIAWLGYDTPDNLLTASEVGPQKQGGWDLAEFSRGIRGANSTAKLTVIGHSYGSSVAGRAIREGLVADHVIFVGSPGVPLRPEDVPKGMDVHVVRAANDPIRYLPSHNTLGKDPVDSGFTRVSADDNQGHNLHGDGYLKRKSEAADNMAYIATHYEEGRPETLSDLEEFREDVRGLGRDARGVAGKVGDVVKDEIAREIETANKRAGAVVDIAEDVGRGVIDGVEEGAGFVKDRLEDAGRLVDGWWPG